MNSMNKLCVLTAMAVFSGSAFAADGHSHQHGKAQLRITVEGDGLAVAFESPLDNLVGFERVPKYEKDFASVKQMAARLRQVGTVLMPTPAAQCAATSVKLASDGIDPALLGESGTAQKAAADHTDLDAEFVFRCAKPMELKGVEVKLFDHFKRIRQIDAVVVTPKRQAASKLTPRARSVAW